MAYADNFYEKKRQLNMFYINDYGGFWIELLPLLIRSNNIVKIYDDVKKVSFLSFGIFISFFNDSDWRV